MAERNDRREEIKLRLEYVKLALSIIGIGSLVFAGLQWQNSNRIANQQVYQRMTADWRDHLHTFIDRPDLRPYFEEGKSLEASDQNRNAVLAFADVRLDVMDALLSFAAFQGWDDQAVTGWRNTFTHAFRSSSALCNRFVEVQENYGLIVPIGDAACGQAASRQR